MVNIMLIYAVIKIRKTIKNLEDAFPNECFMNWHIINFVLIVVMSSLNRATNIIAYEENENSLTAQKFQRISLIISDSEVFVSFYGILFLLYLIVKFSGTKNRD